MDSIEDDIENLDDFLPIRKDKYGGLCSASTDQGLVSGCSDTSPKESLDQRNIGKKKRRKRRKGKTVDVANEEIQKENDETPCGRPSEGKEEVPPAIGCDAKVQSLSGDQRRDVWVKRPKIKNVNVDELNGSRPKVANDNELHEDRENVERTILNSGNSLETFRLEKSNSECRTECQSCDTSESFNRNDFSVDATDLDYVCSNKSAFELFKLAPQDVIVMESQDGVQQTLDPSEVVFVLSEADDCEDEEVNADDDRKIGNPNVQYLVSSYFNAKTEVTHVLCEINEDGKCEDNNGDEERVKCENRAYFEKEQPEFNEIRAEIRSVVAGGPNVLASMIEDVKETDNSMEASIKLAEISMGKGDFQSASEVDIIDETLCLELSLIELNVSFGDDSIGDSSREVIAESMGVCGIGDTGDLEDLLKRTQFYSEEETSGAKIWCKNKIKDLKWEAHKEACEALKTVLCAEESVVYDTESDHFQESGLESGNNEVLTGVEEGCVQNEMCIGPMAIKEVKCSESFSNSSESAFPHINGDLIAEEPNESNEYATETEDCKPGKFKRVILSSEQIGSVENENKANTEMEHKCEDSCQYDACKEIAEPPESAACEGKDLREFDDNFAIIVSEYCEDENVKSVDFPFTTTSAVETKGCDSKRKEQEDANGDDQFKEFDFKSISTVNIEKEDIFSKMLNTTNFKVEYSSGSHLPENIFVDLKNAGLVRKDFEGKLKNASESDPGIFEEACLDSSSLITDVAIVTEEPCEIADKMHLMGDASPFSGEKTTQELLEDSLEEAENTDDAWADTELEVDGYLVYLQDSSWECNETRQQPPSEATLLQRIKMLEGKNSELSARNQLLVWENCDLRARADQAELRLRTELDRRGVGVGRRGGGVDAKPCNAPQCTMM